MRNTHIRYGFIFLHLLAAFGLYGLNDAAADNVRERELSLSPNRGVFFVISKAQIRNWDTGTGEDRSLLALTIDIVNDTKNKKIDLTETLQYTLKDEFGNHYRAEEPPSQYPDAIFVPNQHFPSLYPNEIFSETVFFEDPILQSQNLVLSVDALPIGIDQVIELPLPRKKVQVVLPPPQRRAPQEGDLHIIQPQPERTVSPGDVVLFLIDIPGDIPSPDKVYILAPHYIFEDESRALSYDLRIPAEQKAGPFTVVVMAKWDKEPNIMTISESVTLNVANSQRACVENCLKKNEKTP